MADEGAQGNRSMLALAALAIVALVGAGVAAAYLLPSGAPPIGELPPARPIERPDAPVPGLRRLAIASITCATIAGKMSLTGRLPRRGNTSRSRARREMA